MTAKEEDLAAALAREIRAAVLETAAESAPRTAEPAGGDGQEIRVTLRRAEEYVTPTVPDAARLARTKSLALRALRFLWRDQTSFNALLIEASNGILAALDRNHAAIERQGQDFTDELARLQKASERRDSAQDSRLADLEMLVTRPPASPATARAAEVAPLPESVYALFEERFRGSFAEVTDKQTFYLPFLRDLPGPVFDAGCGRGEFLKLLADRGIPARGVESSGHAVRAARAAGLDVREGDAIEALSAEPARSLGAVVAFQVVEHWPAGAAFRFLAAARRALAPGGVLIVETVNTDSLAAMNAFYLDPTHVRPVPSEGLRFLCEAAGFRELSVEFLSPLPASERLAESSENDARLNALLFGPQDYAVIGRVPRE
ncbi:MAG TPA: methyltransferase domain-containing protein [Thermoanaerobaculia bacterium]|jgi:O-antigen chain-terminating methyltransferase